MSTETYDAVRIFVARNVSEAYFIKGMLEGDGIASEIRNEFTFDARGALTMGPENLPEVWIDKQDAARATGLLQEIKPPQDSWYCPKCHTLLEGQFTTCWSCGSDRPAPES